MKIISVLVICLALLFGGSAPVVWAEDLLGGEDEGDLLLGGGDEGDDTIGGRDEGDDRLEDEGGSVTIKNPLAADSIGELFLTLLQILLIFAIPIIVFFIIYAGFLYVTARGNEEQIKQAHRALTYAIVGGLLILGAEIILQVIQGTVDAFR